MLRKLGWDVHCVSHRASKSQPAALTIDVTKEARDDSSYKNMTFTVYTNHINNPNPNDPNHNQNLNPKNSTPNANPNTNPLNPNTNHHHNPKTNHNPHLNPNANSNPNSAKPSRTHNFSEGRGRTIRNSRPSYIVSSRSACAM